MKAKEWVAYFIGFIRDLNANLTKSSIEKEESLKEIVNFLISDSLKGYRHRLTRDNQELFIQTLRIAAVKYDAVLHQVTLELGSKPPVPFIKGAILLYCLEPYFDYTKNSFKKNNDLLFFKEIAKRLGYLEVEEIKKFFDLAAEKYNNQLADDFIEFSRVQEKLQLLIMKDKGCRLSDEDTKEKKLLVDWLEAHQRRVTRGFYMLDPQIRSEVMKKLEDSRKAIEV